MEGRRGWCGVRREGMVWGKGGMKEGGDGMGKGGMEGGRGWYGVRER